MSLLPIFLKLDGRPALLVGAGAVAFDKVGSLLKSGVRLRVVAPEATPEIRALANDGLLEWTPRAFEPADLDGNFVVIAATNVPEVNAAVYQGCVERGIVCNSVDDIPNCDFFFGSVVSRGDLQIAISTAGESPALAQRLRREIDAQLPDDLGEWLRNLGELRREVLSIHPRSDERKALLHELAQRSVCESETCPSRLLARKPLASHSIETDNAPDTALSSTPVGKVFLVGAGPGDPDLLTVKALRLIQSAKVILHDELVPQAVLSLAPHAVIVNVGKRCGMKSISQQEINTLMVEHAQAGRSVVRLKSGDPLIFGRAAEEMSALCEAGVAFEVVPGITSAFAAAAAIPASLTDRHSASNVIFSTGHHAQSHNDAALPALEDATRVVYMPGRDLTLLAAEWRAEGLPAELPCVLVSHAGQPTQQVFATTLDELGNASPMQAPSLLLAGWSLRNSTISKQLTSIGVAAD
jgi:uroporphyrin-III C-methyltransferase / precorrin-2 dehydrogenase / sirohydrochlorin ferrochelatase